MSEIDCLIDGGTIITMDPQRRVLDDACIAVDGGTIADIGPSGALRGKYTAKTTIDARRRVVMPGLVDLHGHAGNALIKQVAEHFPEERWTNVFDFVTAHTSRDWWYLDSVFSSLEKLKFGTTTSLYMLGSSPRCDDPEIAFANAEGVEKIGIRSVIGVGPSRPPLPRDYTSWANGRRVDRVVSLQEMLEKTEETVGAWSRKKHARVGIWPALGGLLDDTAEAHGDLQPQLEALQQTMQAHGVGFHTHACGADVKFMRERAPGLLGPKTVLAHAWPLDMQDVEILADTNTRVAHCPRAHQVYSRPGRMPLPEMVDAGVVVGLGSDVTGAGRSWNMWEDIYFAPRLHRRILNDPTRMPVGKILEMATIDGAKALGMDDRIGSLEPGKDADLIIINMWKPHIVPTFQGMTTQRVAYFARGEDVETVMVQGCILMQDRRVLGVDENEILEWADEEARHTVSIFGLEPMMRRNDRYWRSARD